jgi:hypothetical protein
VSEPTPPPPKGTGTWRALVFAEADHLEDELERITHPDPNAPEAREYDRIRRNIALARAAAGAGRWPWRPSEWYSGARIETAWASLHRAGEELIDLQDSTVVIAQIPDILAAIEASLKPDDPRATSFEPVLKALIEAQQPLDLSPAARAQIRAARRAANVASDAAHGVVRRWRNLLLIVGLFVGVVVALLAVIHAFVPDFLSLDPPARMADAVEVWAVEAVGAFGGAIAAVLAINRFSGFSDPYGLPLYQALLRIPMATATALLGVVLMQNSVIDALKPQTGTKLLAYAILFGYAQEPLLRLVDRQAGKVLDPARSKDDPVKPKPGQPSTQP